MRQHCGALLRHGRVRRLVALWLMDCLFVLRRTGGIDTPPQRIGSYAVRETTSGMARNGAKSTIEPDRQRADDSMCVAAEGKAGGD